MKTTMLMVAVAGTVVCASAQAEPWQMVRKHVPGVRLPVVPNNPADNFPLNENFDSYSVGVFPCTGAACVGPNGWSVWYTGGSSANISTAQAFSPPNSMEATALSDITQTGDITSGKWLIKAMTYFPTGATGTPRELYFIVQNSYGGIAGQTDDWSVQVRLDGDATGTGAGQVLSDVAATHPVPAVSTPQTLVYDQWIEIRAEIDLVANSYNIYYNNLPVLVNCPYSTATATGTNAVRIACLDLYSNGVAGAFWDNVSVQPVVVASCYANCDASTVAPCLNVNDFICFNNLYAASSTLANCDASTIAPTLNVNDFICFNNLYASSCTNPCAAP